MKELSKPRGAKPTFLGVGAQKCASTWVHRILDGHPKVSVSDPKELDFFSCYFDRGYGWYEQFFAGAGDAIAVGETSPSYFYNEAAIERACAYNPAFKILVCLRDPIERMYSNHLHEVRKGHIAGVDLSFEAGMALNPMYFHQSLYARHLKKWLAAFGAENVLVLLQEDIARDPRAEAARVCAFLGIDADFDSEFFDRRANENVVYRSPAIGAVYGAIGGAARAVGMGGVIRWAKKTDGVSSIWSAAKENLRERVAPMRPETIAALRADLADDMSALAALLSRADLPWPTWRALTEKAA